MWLHNEVVAFGTDAGSSGVSSAMWLPYHFVFIHTKDIANKDGH